MNCKELNEISDSYVSDELLVETNHEVLRHLENCADCRRVVSGQRLLRRLIRAKLKSAPETRLDPAFATRLTAQIRETALAPSALESLFGVSSLRGVRVAALAFAAIVLFALGGVFLLNRPDANVSLSANTTPNNKTAQESSGVGVIRAVWNEIASHAAGDHENCAVKFGLKEKPISLDEAARKYEPNTKDLGEAIKAALNIGHTKSGSGDTEFLKAHSCLYEGRRFTHLVLRHKGRLVSLLVTGTDLPDGDGEIQTARFDELGVSGFHVSRHAVFVVSDLPSADNIDLARQIAPAVRLQAKKKEA